MKRCLVKTQSGYVRTTAVAVALAVLTSGCAGVAASDSVDSGDTSWDPQTLDAIAVAQSGQGEPAAPVYNSSVVTETQGLAVSLQPQLQVTSAPANDPYTFSISTLQGNGSTTIWSAPANTNSVQVDPTAKLEQGNTYQWQAVDTSTNTTYGPYVMAVDSWRSGKQATQSFGPVSVDLATGALSMASALRSLNGASGPVGVNLLFRAGQSNDPGLPAGWAMQGTGQTWSHLQVFDGSVALVSVTGAVTSFEQSTNGSGTGYAPVAPTGRPAPTGQTPTLAQNPDQTWTVTMPSGLVSVFAAATNGIAPLTATYSGSEASPEYQLDNGVITSVTDSIASDLAVDLVYGGESGCPSVPDVANLIATPSGQLCAIKYPEEGNETWFFYSGNDVGPMLARIVDYPNTSDYKASVTDFGYDQAGRLVEVREPQAANVLANGSRSSGVTTQIAYNDGGQVQTVTKPTANANDTAAVYALTYGPGPGSGTTYVDGPGMPGGTHYLTVTYDSATLLPTSSTDPRNQTGTDTWNTALDQKVSSTDQNGLTTSYVYDDDQNLTQWAGPYSGNPSDPYDDQTVPGRSFSYDQDVSTGQPNDMQGFNVTYWTNDQLSGVPSSREFGPKPDGNSVPGNTQWNWQNSPTGQDSPWSARLTGLITLPDSGGKAAASKAASKSADKAAGKQKVSDPANYSFAIANSASLWIDNLACGGSCTMPLPPGEYPIRIDLPVSDPTGTGGAGVDLTWQLPDGGGQVAIPMSYIRPAYGLASVVNQHDAFAEDSPTTTQFFTDFSQPWTGKPTSGWSPQISSIKGTRTYEPFNPSEQQFGRQLTATLPAGNQLQTTYYGPEESANIPCSGFGNGSQHGLGKTVVRGGQTYTSFYDDMGRVVGAQINDSDPVCTYYNDAGQISKVVVPDRSDEQPGSVTTYNYLVNGDPLTSSVTVQATGGQAQTATSVADIFGRPIQTTDVWGTVQTTTFDQFFGNPQTQVTKTPNGFTTTLTTGYDDYGDLSTVTLNDSCTGGGCINNLTLASVHPPTATRGEVNYGNGVRLMTESSEIGGFGSQQWTTSDNQSFLYSNDSSAAQRILSEQFGFGSAQPNANFSYSYDQTGRLTNAVLKAPSLSPAHTQWSFGYDTSAVPNTEADAGLNSNRTMMTVDSATTNYGYDNNDQLTATTDPNVGSSFSYSGWGELNNVGSLTIDYDATGAPSVITDSATGDTVTYTRAEGTILQKTSVIGGTTTVARNSSSGFVLDGNNNPQWQAIGLPGGAALVRDMTGVQKWQFETARGQRMWTADATGKDTGEWALYSPYGEALLPATGTPATRKSKPAGKAAAKPSTSPSTSASTSPPTESAKPAASAPTPTASASPPKSSNSAAPPADQVYEPNFGWMAGNAVETETIGLTDVVMTDARLYLPVLGRFTSVDPVLQGSANAYDYANQDPINQSDPTGNMPTWMSSLVSVGLQIGTMVLSQFLTDGLATYGLTAASGMKYVAANMLVAAATSLASAAISQALLYPGGTPFYENWVNDASFFVSVYWAHYSSAGMVKVAETKQQATEMFGQVTKYLDAKIDELKPTVKDYYEKGEKQMTALQKQLGDGLQWAKDTYTELKTKTGPEYKQQMENLTTMSGNVASAAKWVGGGIGAASALSWFVRIASGFM